MKHLQFAFLSLLLISVVFTSCKKEVVIPDVPGCMDESALNYNANATIEDGTCEYPKTFMPHKAGNTWSLSDEVNFFIPITVTATLSASKDTTIDSRDYTLIPESYEAQGLGQFDDIQYGYRTAVSGNVYRRLVTQDSLGPDSKLIDYPLTVGKNWIDSEVEATLNCSVVSNGTVTVPAGTFENVWAISYTRISDGITSTIFFAEDIGIIKIASDLEFQGQQVNLEFELDSYTVN